MAGDNSPQNNQNAKLIGIAASTPTDTMDGVQCSVALLALQRYTVNLRSFHPNAMFEKLGFRFEGDRRGFSTKKSGHTGRDVDPQNKAPEVTSRIYQRFVLDTEKTHTVNAKSQEGPGTIGFITASNTSRNLHPIGQYTSDGEESYENPLYQPKGVLTGTVTEPHGGQVIADIHNSYAGKNFAFIGSRLDQQTLGTTVVPDLDVTMHLFVRIERVCHYMDIAVLAWGDGFPNCEAFLTDPSGRHVFLGTHVRMGTPATHLPGANQRLMFGHVLRVELDVAGNFADKLWGFTHCLGGTPERREDYPAIPDLPLPKGRATIRVSNNTPLLPNAMASGLAWADDFEQLGDGKSGTAAKPLNISAYRPVGETWTKLQAAFMAGPTEKSLSRTGWNQLHEKRNPNEGRAPDDYDFKP